MAENTFAVAFDGAIADGADAARVKASVARLFKVEPAKVEPLFSGKRVYIKKNIDRATALKYQAALQQAGALCEVVDLASPASEGPSQAPAPSGMTLAEPGVVLIEPERVEAPDIDVSALTMAETGVTLVEPERVEPPAIDTRDLSLAEAGATLGESEAVQALEVDLRGITLAEPGVILVEPEAVEPPQIDTSRLSVT